MSNQTNNPLVAKVNALQEEIGKVVIGYKDVKLSLIMALMSDGHVLIESMPGLAKTMLINTLQSAIAGAKSGRIQFNPDLKPNDVIGVRIFNGVLGKYEFTPGPALLCNLLLADELNRATALTQSALLQPMQERFVDIPGMPRQFLADPFMVMATINPVEQEGTFALPEAQLDRFMFKLIMTYVSREEEIQVVKNTQVHGRNAMSLINQVISVEDLLQVRKEVEQLAANASDSIREYIVDLMRATRPVDATFKKVKANGKTFEDRIAYGASPRLAIWVLKGASCHAWLAGRDHIEPDDVKFVLPHCLRHRLILTQEAVFDGFSADEFITALLETVPVVGQPKPTSAKK